MQLFVLFYIKLEIIVMQKKSSKVIKIALKMCIKSKPINVKFKIQFHNFVRMESDVLFLLNYNISSPCKKLTHINKLMHNI